MRIVVCDKLAEEGLKVLRESADVDVRLGPTKEELVGFIGEYDALVVRSETKVTAEVIEAGTKLKVIGRAGVGVDNIDVPAASKRGVVVVNAPLANTIAAAEHTVALMLSMARNVPQADASLRAGLWQKSKYMGAEIRQKVLGVVGLGRIGQEVSKRAQGLMMRVIAFDPYVTKEHGAKLGIQMMSLEDVLRAADFVTIHTPLTTSTKGLIGARELSMMKPTARLINCARGGLVDEDALFEALSTGKLAGAALDVFVQEPPKDNRLLTLGNLVATPHLGASTTEAQIGVAIDIADQVLAVLRGEPATYAVNVPVFSAEVLNALAPLLPLAECVGLVFAQLYEGQVESLEVEYSGKVGEYDTAPLTAAVLKGVLQTISEDEVTLMNSTLLAKSRGLRIVEQKSSDSVENYSSLLTLRATGAGIAEVAGTIVHGAPRIVKLGEYRVDIQPTNGYLLVAEHVDQPGMIGKVGTLMGDADINISFMQVGRAVPRGEAMMVLSLDEPVPDAVLDRVKGLPSMRRVRVLRY